MELTNPTKKLQILKWINAAWDSMTHEVVWRSFLKTGIFNDIDGYQAHLLFESDNEDDNFFTGSDEVTPETGHQFRENLQLELGRPIKN